MKKLFQVIVLSCLFCQPFSLEGYETIRNEFDWPVLSPKQKNVSVLKIRLENGLEAFLIQDPNAPKSAVGISVEAGSMMNPKEYLGLAHFLEHALFLGSDKYPGVSEFFDYVGSNGGTENAYTSVDHTLYYFDVAHNAFFPSLDRLAQFFIAPRFDFSAVDRELNAVNQENEKNKDSDAYRTWELAKQHFVQDHPIKNFATGNLETLKTVTPQVLRNWYNDHYTPDKMHLVLYSTASLEEMAQHVEEYYGAIPRRVFRDATQFPKIVCDPSKGGEVVWIQSVNNLRFAEIFWEIPSDLIAVDKFQSYNLVADLLNSQHSSGVASQLKELGWITNMSCGIDRFSKNQGTINVTLELSPEGIKNIDALTKMLTDGIQSLKNQPLPSYLFEEKVKLAQLNYAFPIEKSSQDRVIEIAKGLIYEPLATYPRLTLAPQELDTAKIQELLGEMTLAKAHINISCSQEESPYSFTEKEFYSEASYSLHPLNQNVEVKKLLADFPPKNKYVPTDLKLSCEVKKPLDGKLSQPQQVIEGAWGRLTVCEDDRYNVPKIFWGLCVKTPKLQSMSPQDIVLEDVLVFLTKKSLEKELFEAQKAGLLMDCGSSDQGIVLFVAGFRQKAVNLLTLSLDQLTHLKVSEEDFRLAQDSLAKIYFNGYMGLSVKQGIEVANSSCIEGYLTFEQKQNIVKSLSYEDFKNFQKECFSKVYIDALVYGNEKIASMAEQIHLFENVSGAAYPVSEHVVKTMNKIVVQDSIPLLSIDSNFGGNAAVLAIQQGSSQDPRNRAVQDMLNSVLGNEFMAELRTHQQTGYIAKAGAFEKANSYMTLLLVQSTSHHPQALLARFDLFLETFLRDFDKICPEEKFNQLRAAQIEALTISPPSLELMGRSLMDVSLNRDHNFDCFDQQLKVLQEMTYQEFVSCVQSSLGPENRSRFAVIVNGSAVKDTVHYQEVTSLQNLCIDSKKKI